MAEAEDRDGRKEKEREGGKRVEVLESYGWCKKPRKVSKRQRKNHEEKKKASKRERHRGSICIPTHLLRRHWQSH